VRVADFVRLMHVPLALAEVDAVAAYVHAWEATRTGH
jgi:hypothetical protein